MASQVSGVIEYIQPGGSSGTKHAIAATAYGVCDTAANEPIKNVDMTGFKLEKGTTVHIKFINTNSANGPKLKFNSEADANAKPIVQYGTTAAGVTEETNGWYAGAVLTLTYDGTSWVRDQGFNSSGITSVTIGATSPVQSSTSTAQNGSSASTTISLKDAYGDTKNPYGTKAKNLVLAGPSSGSNAAPTFRALVAADIPDLSGTYVKKVTSTDNAIARFDGTSGQVQNSGVTIDDSNIITANASGHSFSNIKIYTHTANAGKDHIGWIKFASADMNSNNYYGNCTYDIHLSRTYNSPSPEVYNLRITVGWGSTNILLLGGKYNGHIMTKFRVARDNTNHKIYFEYYVDTTATTYSNMVNIRIICYSGYNLTLLNEVQTEAETDFAVKEEIELTNGIVGGLTGNASSSSGVKDYHDSTLTTFGYSTSGMTSTSWLGSWDATVSGEYRLRAISPANAVKSAVGTTQIGGTTTPIYWTGSAFSAGTALSGGAYKDILNNTSAGALGWNSGGNSNANNLRLINVNTLAYWNGAYSGTNSNLAYYKGGAFGTMAKETATNYLARSGGQMTGPLTWKDSTALPQASSLSYILGIDAFASGGTTKWIDVDGLRTSLGLSNALHFIGITSTTLTDGSTTATLTAKSTGSLSKTTGFVDGDVVMDGDQLREYVWSGSAWRLLGITTSTAYTQPASTATNTWIAQVSQGTDGKITATTGSLNTSGTWSGTASKATTTANTTDSIYPVGVKSGATTTLLHDTSITMKGNAITAVTYNSTAASLTSETSTTANTAKYATLTLGNNANVNTTTAHSEGQIVIYSAATQAHTIKGTSTTTAYTHTLPNNTGLLVSLSGGTAKGSSTKPVYIPNTGIVTECSTYAGGTKVTFNGADKGASTASFYAPTAGGTAGHVLIGAGTTTAPAWYGGTVMSGSAAASWKTAFNGTTDATASNAAAVTIAGGLGIAKSIIVGTTATITTNTRSPKFTLTVNDADKAYLQYNTTDNSIDFIFV